MKNEKLFRQFTVFLKTIRQDTVSPETIKLVNLIIDNFDEIVETGRAAGKRASIINELIQKKEAQTLADAFHIPQKSNRASVQQLLRLQSLEAAHFRGFTDHCVFSFDKQYVLVYGPNGSGKSSLCESLEYTLLGYINEATQKRIPLPEYIKNSYTPQAKMPSLKGVDENGELVAAISDPDLYHFCFVEKCRIDAFARLSAHTPTGQKELLSVLFGLEDFDSFVTEFTDNIEKYIPVEPVKQNELERQKQLVAGHRQVLEGGESKRTLRQLEKQNIEAASKTEYSFDELDVLVHGNGVDDKGWLEHLQEQLTASSEMLLGNPSIDHFFSRVDAWRQVISHFRQTQARYEAQVRNIDFVNLYAGIVAVEKYKSGVCPACETPLFATIKDPYDHARRALDALKEAAEIEQVRKQRWSAFILQKEEVMGLWAEVVTACTTIGTAIEIAVPPQLNKNQPVELLNQHTILPLCEGLLDQITAQKTVLKTAEQAITAKNKQAQNSREEREMIVRQYNGVKKLSDRIKAVQTEERTTDEFVLKAKNAIEDFDTTTGKLQSEALEETKQIDTNKKYIEAYKTFNNLLRNFKNQLPIDLVKDLSLLVKEFYNLINKDDDEKDLLATVQLPALPQHHISVSFRDQPDKQVNVLQVLSEGHIKCLGLAILLAKAVHSGANFIIFDDIVNAIDDDHRGYIRDLFLTSPHFADKQLIITSHSEEFIKDFENRISKKESSAKIQTIALLRNAGKKIEKVETTHNYLLRADKGLTEHNKREALMNCRRALESISVALWNKLIGLDNGKYNVKVSVKLWGPKHKPELLALLKSLRKIMNGIDYPIITEISQSIDWLSGLETTQPNIWNLLNKGTHEESDRDDFDGGIVKEIFSQTCLLDEKVKGGWEKKS